MGRYTEKFSVLTATFAFVLSSQLGPLLATTIPNPSPTAASPAMPSTSPTPPISTDDRKEDTRGSRVKVIMPSSRTSATTTTNPSIPDNSGNNTSNINTNRSSNYSGSIKDQLLEKVQQGTGDKQDARSRNQTLNWPHSSHGPSEPGNSF